VMKNLKKRASSHEYRFPKTLFTLSRCWIAEDDGSGDLLSRSHMHIDERDDVALAAQQQRRQKPRCVGGLWLFVVTRSMVAAHIYREDTPRIAATRNRLGLSLLKQIRYGLIAKINGKRKPQTCEALGRISVDHSHTHRAPTPIASPHHIMPHPTRVGPARRGE
jgi:hypothetical protein